MLLELIGGTTMMVASILQTLGWAALSAVLGLGLFIFLLPWISQPFIRVVLALRYDMKRLGKTNLPRKGGVLIVSNHMTWFDGFFIAGSCPRRGTAIVNAAVFSMPVIGFLAKRCGLIPVPYKGPKAQRAAIEACRKALDDGQALVIFPESQLSRTGLTGPFFRGLELILSDRESIPVVPAYIDNGWGSIMSHSDNSFLWKKPKGWRRRVVVCYGPPMEPPITAFRARQAVLVQGVVARSSFTKPIPLPEPIDFSLPYFEHPTLGKITASAQDVNEPRWNVFQRGHKEGSVGVALPGLAVRVVNEQGIEQGPEVEGKLQAMLPHKSGWLDLGRTGKLDKEGFLFLTEPAPQA